MGERAEVSSRSIGSVVPKADSYALLETVAQGRKRIGELIKLGAFERQAILTGLSRKGYWHLAKTLSMNVGLSNAYLTEQGLTSLRTLWIKIHHPATAR